MNIANRNTVSKRVPEIDSLYVYHTSHFVKFHHRHQPGTGYRYMSHKVLLQAGEDEIHIYHRTATINGVSKGLTMVTKQSKVREVQKWFKEQIALIEDDAKLFDKFSHAKSSPTQLGLFYTY